MNLAPLFLLPIIGGFALITFWKRQRYHIAREEGHRLYFRSAFWGTVLVLLAIPMHGLLFACWDAYQLAVETLAEAIGAPATRGMWGEASQAFILFESMFIGPALAVILNTPIYLERCSFLPAKMVGFFARWYRQILNGALESNHFEQLTMRALDTSLPMMVTMKTGKVYVGWALDIPNPAEERKTFRLLPILSGYRDERHKVCFTTDYEVASEVTEALPPDKTG